MSREAHVRIWERVGVRFPCATRHIITDTSGHLVGAQVHTADIQDRDAAPGVLASIRYFFPWLRHVPRLREGMLCRRRLRRREAGNRSCRAWAVDA